MKPVPPVTIALRDPAAPNALVPLPLHTLEPAHGLAAPFLAVRGSPFVAHYHIIIYFYRERAERGEP